MKKLNYIWVLIFDIDTRNKNNNVLPQLSSLELSQKDIKID
jgi:hypothetical protein